MHFYSFRAATKDPTELQTKGLLLQMAEKEPGLVFHIMTNNPGPVGNVTSPSWCSCNHHCEMDNDMDNYAATHTRTHARTRTHICMYIYNYVLMYIVSLLNIGIIAVPGFYTKCCSFPIIKCSVMYTVFFRMERPTQIQCEW